MPSLSRLVSMFVLSVALAQPALATDRIWFAPLPGWPGVLPLPGTQDYWSLFSDSAPWPNAMNRTGVFKMIVQTVDLAPSDDALRNALDFLKRHNIAFALEAGPVNIPAGCDPNLAHEGYGGIAIMEPRIARIKALGGELAYVAMDEPYQFVAHDATGACRLSPQQLAANINDTRNMVRNYFPNVKFGDVEPFVHFEDDPNIAANYAAFLDAFANITGVPMEFVHNEGDVELWAWQDTDAKIRPVLDARGIKYGIIWHGMNVGAHNNHDWVQAALWRINYYRGLGRTLPDHHIFQSWDGYPTAAMPDSNPDTFSSLLNNAMNVVSNVDTQTGCGPSSCVYYWPGGWVGGWSLDLAANRDSGIDAIHVWNITTGTFIGTTTFGARPDVAAYFGSQYQNSGWMVWVPQQPYGANTVCFYPHSSVSGTFVWDRVTCTTVNEYYQY